MQPIKQGSDDAVETVISFVSSDFASLQTRLTGTLALTASIVRPDQTVVTGTGTFSEPDLTRLPGVRLYHPSAADLSVAGYNVMVFKATGMETREVPVAIMPADPYALPGSRYSMSFHALHQSETDATKRVVPFTAVSSTSLSTRLNASSLTWTVRILKADGSVHSGAGSVVQPSFSAAPGVCFYVAATEDLDVIGPTVIRLSATGAETRELDTFVVPFDPFAALPTTGFTWQSLIDRARVYVADDHDSEPGHIKLDKWMLFGQVEYQALRRNWMRMGLIRPAITTTTFTGPSITLAGVEAIAGVAAENGYGAGPRVLRYEDTTWPSTNLTPAVSWMATGNGGDLTITVEPADTSSYVVKWVPAVPYVADPAARVELPAGVDERLVLGMAKRALVKDSSRSAPLEELIATQDAQIAFTTMAQVRPGPRVLAANPRNQGFGLSDPKYWRYY